MHALALPRRRHAARGFTLIELLIVVAILVAAAAVAVQSAGPLAELAVDAAHSEVQQAIRFARSEAMRTGMPRVVSIGADNVARVYRLSYAGATPGEDVAHPVDHPVDKKSYRVALSEPLFFRPGLVTVAAFRFDNGTVSSTLAFLASGEPVTIVGPAPTDVSRLVAAAPGTAHVTLASGAATRTVTVDPVTGRVRAT